MIVLLCVSVIGIPFFIIFYFLLLYFKNVGKGKHSTCSGTIILYINSIYNLSNALKVIISIVLL